jgi:large subunit ribosomal protein L25
VSEVHLVVQSRRQMGSRACRRLRGAGQVPAVLYGHGVEPRPLAVDGRQLRHALSGEAGLNALLRLDIDGSRQLAMARQLQRHPVRGTVEHVDFVIVRLDEVVSAEVPVRLVGEATEVERADGVIEHSLFSLPVRAKPADIPAHVDVDISGLAVGDIVRVADIELPPGVEAGVDGEEPVVSAVLSRVATEVEAAEEAAAEEAAAELAAVEVAEGAVGVEEGAEARAAGEEGPEAGRGEGGAGGPEG